MAGVVVFICLSGLTFSRNIKSVHVQNAMLKVEARTSSADADFQIGQSGLVGVV